MSGKVTVGATFHKGRIIEIVVQGTCRSALQTPMEISGELGKINRIKWI